jgi:hypothetical protein
METPKAVKACNLTDTPNTTCSSIFDSDDSPLSSARSSVLGDLDDNNTSEYEEEKPLHHLKPSNGAQNIPLRDDLNNCGTASSQRERRALKKAPVYSNFFSDVKEQSPEPPEINVPPAPITTHDSVQPATVTAHAQYDEESAHQTPKCKEQATATDSTERSLLKKVKAAPVRHLGSKLDTEPALAEGVLQLTGPAPTSNCAPSRLLRKRKLNTTATEAAQLPPSKRVKAAPTKTQSKLKGKSPRATKGAAPPKSKKRSSTGQATTTVLPKKSGSVVVLKMSPHRLAELGHLAEDIFGEASTSQDTSRDADETIPFESTSFQSLRSGLDQCAQLVPAPIPASSQVTSFDDSQSPHISFQSQNANLVVLQLLTVSGECEIEASQKLPTPPYLPAAETEGPKAHAPEDHVLQSQSSVPDSEHAALGPGKACSVPSTQPTQILPEPYSKRRFHILLFQG